MKDLITTIGQGFGAWLFRQNTSTVLLFALVALNAAGLAYVPSIAGKIGDRVERLVEGIGATYQADQDRDHAEKMLLLDKLAEERQPKRDKLASRP